MDNYTAADTAWPEQGLPLAIKELLVKFWVLTDTNKPGIGDEIAADIFAPHATMAGPKGNLVGSKQIRTCRDGVWEGIKERQHWLTSVYVLDSKAMDLVVLGRAKLTSDDGSSIYGEFAGHFLIDGESLDIGKPKFKYLQVYGVPAQIAARIAATQSKAK